MMKSRGCWASIRKGIKMNRYDRTYDRAEHIGRRLLADSPQMELTEMLTEGMMELMPNGYVRDAVYRRAAVDGLSAAYALHDQVQMAERTVEVFDRLLGAVGL